MITYCVKIEKDDNDTWLFHCPDVPGAITFGDTIEEALENGREAVEACIECDRDRGFPVPSADYQHSEVIGFDTDDDVPSYMCVEVDTTKVDWQLPGKEDFDSWPRDSAGKLLRPGLHIQIPSGRIHKILSISNSAKEEHKYIGTILGGYDSVVLHKCMLVQEPK